MMLASQLLQQQQPSLQGHTLLLEFLLLQAKKE